MLPRVLAVLLVASTLLVASRVEAYLVVPNHRRLFTRAAHTAMRCPDMVTGRYVVEVTLTDRHIEARVVTAPRIPHETEQCIVRAFELQAIADAIPEGRGTFRIPLEFVMDATP